MELDTFSTENLLHSNTQAIFISFYRHKLSRVKQNNEIMSYLFSHMHIRHMNKKQIRQILFQERQNTAANFLDTL